MKSKFFNQTKGFYNTNKKAIYITIGLIVYCILFQTFNNSHLISSFMWNYAILLYDFSLAVIVGLLVYFGTTSLKELKDYQNELWLIREKYLLLNTNFFNQFLYNWGITEYPETKKEFTHYQNVFKNLSPEQKKIFELLSRSTFDLFNTHISEIDKVISPNNPLYSITIEMLQKQPAFTDKNRKIEIFDLESMIMILTAFKKKLDKELNEVGFQLPKY